jgi:F0F1-type ATP synthase membrane subunit b/b'
MPDEVKPITATECHDLQKMLEKDLTRFEALGRAKNVIQRLGQALQIEGETQARIASLREQEATTAAELQGATTSAAEIVQQATHEASRIVDEARTRALEAADEVQQNARAALDGLAEQITERTAELAELSTRVERVRAALG